MSMPDAGLAAKGKEPPSNAAVVGDPASRAKTGERSLDGFAFFCANLQTGFGPFVSVYLTTEKWSQTDIGLVLMIGGLIGLFGQMPGGALVDHTRAKILLAAASLTVIGVAAAMEDHGGRLRFATNLGDEVEAGVEHPMRFTTEPDGGIKPYVHVRGDLWARLTRTLAIDLLDRVTRRDARVGIASGDSFFPIALAGAA